MRKLAILLVILLLISASAVVGAGTNLESWVGYGEKYIGNVMNPYTMQTNAVAYNPASNQVVYYGAAKQQTVLPEYVKRDFEQIHTAEIASLREQYEGVGRMESQPATPAPTTPAEVAAGPQHELGVGTEAGPETTAPAEGATGTTGTPTPAGTTGTASAEEEYVREVEEAAYVRQVEEAEQERLAATAEERALGTGEGPGGVTPPAQPTPTGPQGQTLMGRIGGDTTVRRDSSGQLNFYREDGTQITGTDLETYRSAHAEDIASYEQQARDQMEKEGTFLTNFVQSYRIYSGLQGYSSLIFDKEFLADWRKKVNDIFCNKVLGYLPLSRDCWTSTVCGIYTEITPPQDGVLFTAPVGGLPAVSAHIEGERSLPIVTPNQTYWVYKVTFSVTNPLDETLKINVYFSSAEKKAAWWPADQEVGEGNTFAAVGASALMKLSSTDYSEVCLSFSPSLESFGGRRTGSICNGIPQYAGGATAPYSVTTGNETTAQPGAAPSTPTTPGANI